MTLRVRARGVRALLRPARVTVWAIAALAAGVAALTLSRHAWTASGADPSGYVSEAELWRRGSLLVDLPLAQDAPWAEREWPFAPLGYRPALKPFAMVPTYPAGLPLTLAAAQLVGGERAAYVVVPLVAGLGVWFTFLLGRQAGGPAAGAIAAVLLAVCPIYLRQSTQVMSDVPATAWWALALVLAPRAGVRSAFGSGLAASLAIATRPNLAPLGLAVAVAALLATRASWKPAATRLSALAAGALPGCLLVAVFNSYLYGSPLRSGYGENADLYAVANILPNARLYTAWLVEGQTAMLLLVFGALAFPRLVSRPARDPGRHEPQTDDAPAGGPAPFASQVPLWLAIALIVCGYLPYAVFEDWWYIRFLLPAFPAAFVLMALGLLAVARLVPARLRTAALVAATAALVAVSIDRTRALQSLDLARDERRYRDVTNALATAIPASSAFISMQHSGSVHYYLDRPILRWELLPPDRLDASIAYLASKGYRTYILLDSWEAPPFRARFAAASPIGQLDWPPILEVRSPTPVRLFDPADRARYFAGERINTALVFPPRR